MSLPTEGYALFLASNLLKSKNLESRAAQYIEKLRSLQYQHAQQTEYTRKLLKLQ